MVFHVLNVVKIVFCISLTVISDDVGSLDRGIYAVELIVVAIEVDVSVVLFDVEVIVDVEVVVVFAI